MLQTLAISDSARNKFARLSDLRNIKTKAEIRTGKHTAKIKADLQPIIITAFSMADFKQTLKFAASFKTII